MYLEKKINKNIYVKILFPDFRQKIKNNNTAEQFQNQTSKL